jgi:hypothetical protein
MGTWTAQRAGNWSVTSDNGASPWSDGGAQTALSAIPAAGDDVALAGFVVTWDAGIAAIPATGSLASITSTGTAGQLAINLADAAFHGGATLNCTTITAGTKPTTVGLILVTGTDHTLTINATTINGGTNTNSCGINNAATTGVVIINATTINGGTSSFAYGVYHSGNTGTTTINANLIGGSGGGANGLNISATGTVTINGNVTGGTGTQSSGVTHAAAATATLGAGYYIKSGTGGVGWSGRPPVWNPNADMYIEWYTNGALNKHYYDIPSEANVRDNDTVAGVTGTMVTRTPDNSTVSQLAGYYAAFNLATVDADLVVANIKAGVTIFGLAGEASGGGDGSFASIG